MTWPISWPPIEAFRAQTYREVASDGTARCVGLAICAENGQPARTLFHGETVQVFFEVEVLTEIETPIGWFEIHDASGELVHGRSSAQLAASPPQTVPAGGRLQLRFSVGFDLGPGVYFIALGLSSVDQETYAQYQVGPPRAMGWPDCDVPLRERSGMNRQSPIAEERFLERLDEHCRIAVSDAITVGFDDQGRRPYSGLANLPASCEVTVAPPEPPDHRAGTGLSHPSKTVPTIIHVTHPKAGSQWVAQILADAAPGRIVPPRLRSGQLFFWAVQPEMVYPTVYALKPQFDTVSLPEDTRVFVVVRDLRDTLISYYFSFLKSHSAMDRAISDARGVLSRLSLEEGLLYMLDGWLSPAAQIQLSWHEAGYRLVKYEDLVENDVELFERVLIDDCGLDVSPARLRSIVLANRFERYTNGRQRGQEEQGHHYRKGIAGDWVNHFTEPVKRAFKARYGGLLVETGYERDLSW